MLRPGFLFGSGVQLAVFRRLLSLIFLVVPGHAGVDLREVRVLSVDNDFPHQPSVLIRF